MSRILRCLVCFLLICCMLVNLSPLNAQASSLGATAAITAASTVLSPVGLVVGATFVALGLAAAANPEGFQNMVDAGVSALESAGTWVKDGMVELLRTEDADGNSSYYVDSGLMDDVRSWTLDSGTVVNTGLDVGSLDAAYQSALQFCSTHNYFVYATRVDANTGALTTPLIAYSSYSISVESLTVYAGTYQKIYSGALYVLQSDGSYAKKTSSLGPVTNVHVFKKGDSVSSYSASVDVNLGVYPSVPVDGTSARQWSEEYTDRGLKVYGGGSGNNNNDGKWFWPLALSLTAAELYAMSQADQWSGETPKEFDDYSSVEEFEIVSRPEVEFGQGLELAPVTSPSPDPGTGTNPGTGTDPDPGTNPGTGTNPDPGTDPNPDSGTSTDPSGSWTPSGDMQHFTLDLKEYFPFCIPFDLYDFFTCLNADPVAPVIEWVIPLPGGDTYPLELDLSTFDPVAQLLRRLQLLLFCVGLAFKTRDLIKG